MGLAQSGADLEGDIEDMVEWKRALTGLFSEVLPLDVFHRDEGLFRLVIDLIDGADVRMGEGRRGLGFDDEPLPDVLVQGKPGREKLQGYGTFEARIIGQINNPHSTPAEDFVDLVMTDDHAPGGKLHRPSGDCPGK